MQRLLVVRLGSLGDLVHTLPAVAALRRAYPQAQIDWLVDGAHRDFLDLVPVVSSVVALDGRGLGAWRRVLPRLRAERYDVAIDFQGLIKSALLARASGARRVLGFDRAALREPAAAMFYTEGVPVGEGRHVIDKNLKLASALDATSRIREFPLRRVDSAVLRDLRAHGLGAYALLNCGAAWPNKRWPAERFGLLARHLRDHHGLQSVALWGRGEEDVALKVVEVSDEAAVLAPETDLTELVALCREAALMVSGDTGPTHIATAVGAPVVSLFGPTDPNRNGSWNTADLVCSRYDACVCHYQRRCHRPAEEWCLGTITLDEVRRAVDARLSSHRASQTMSGDSPSSSDRLH